KVCRDRRSRMESTRREFLKTAALSAGALAKADATVLSAPLVHAAGDDVLKVGLVGCGGRGTGAAAQALKADPNVKLVAMGDAFADRIEKSLAELGKDQNLAAKLDVSPAHRFAGFDAYKHVIAAADVVLLCTP